jgi:hypothetical protein
LFIYLFTTDQPISLTLQRRLIEAFEDFSKDVLSACSYEPAAASIPVTVNRISKVHIYLILMGNAGLIRFMLCMCNSPGKLLSR